MNNGIIICSRIDSSRVPNKVFKKINGKPTIEYLIERIESAGIPIIIAVPDSQKMYYEYLSEKYESVSVDGGSYDNPMLRMYESAVRYKIDNVVRICHDKIFVSPKEIKMALKVHGSSDYTHGSFTPGTGFEVIKTKKLKDAIYKFNKFEHAGYAVRSISTDIKTFRPRKKYDIRLLLDYPEDFEMMEKLIPLVDWVKDCPASLAFTVVNNSLDSINALPTVTIYTCAYNASEYIDDCTVSVANQTYDDYEYIVIDDCSSDDTYLKLGMNQDLTIKNEKNIGLAACSNLALSKARGKYIIRLDADDYFSSPKAIEKMVEIMEHSDIEALYPNNQFQKGNENHHAGCAMFRSNAINAIKFDSQLRGYEGLDFFMKAKKLLKIGYMDEETYFYRQHDDSMSKTNLEDREKIKEKICQENMQTYQ